MPILRYNYFLKHHFVDPLLLQSSFKRNINVPFQPDELIIKYSYYQNDGQQLTIYLLSDLIDTNEIFCLLGDKQYHQLNTVFKMGKPVNGTYEFTIHDLDGQPRVDYVGDFIAHLEFIKYD